MSFIIFYKKWIEPFTAILILIALIFLSTMVYKSFTIQEQIKDNCGWEDEGVRCICERGEVVRMENELKGLNNFTVGDFENAKVPR